MKSAFLLSFLVASVNCFATQLKLKLTYKNLPLIHAKVNLKVNYDSEAISGITDGEGIVHFEVNQGLPLTVSNIYGDSGLQPDPQASNGWWGQQKTFDSDGYLHLKLEADLISYGGLHKLTAENQEYIELQRKYSKRHPYLNILDEHKRAYSLSQEEKQAYVQAMIEDTVILVKKLNHDLTRLANARDSSESLLNYWKNTCLIDSLWLRKRELAIYDLSGVYDKDQKAKETPKKEKPKAKPVKGQEQTIDFEFPPYRPMEDDDYESIVASIIQYEELARIYWKSYEESKKKPEPRTPEREYPPLDFPGEPAEFPGGQKALMSYLADNLKYPDSAKKNKISGRVYTKFVVDVDGKITNVTVQRSIPECPECSTEAIRVVEAMPVWTPSKTNGKPVKSYFNLPIKFEPAKN